MRRTLTDRSKEPKRYAKVHPDVRKYSCSLESFEESWHASPLRFRPLIMRSRPACLTGKLIASSTRTSCLHHCCRDIGRRFGPLAAPFAIFYFRADEELTRMARVMGIETLIRPLLARPDDDAFLALSDRVLWGDFRPKRAARVVYCVPDALRRGSIPAATAHQRGRVAHHRRSSDLAWYAMLLWQTRAHRKRARRDAAGYGARRSAGGLAVPHRATARRCGGVHKKALPCPERPRRFEEVISQPRVASRGAV